MAQVAAAAFGGATIPFYIVQAATALVLLLAANTAFNGFPLLGSVLARDSYAPKALLTRGDRLIYSNGVIVLSLVAAVLLLVYRASVTNLIQLYIIGVFVSFTLGQTGMVRHWIRLLRSKARRTAARSMQSLVTNLVGASLTATRARDRHHHQVHPRRLARVRDHADPLVPDARREPVLPGRREGDRGRPAHHLRGQGRPRDRARRADAEAGAEGDRLRDRRPARVARGRAHLHRRRRDEAARGGVGADEHRRAAHRRAVAVPRHRGAADQVHQERTGPRTAPRS